MIGKKDSLLSNMFAAVISEKLILGAIDSPVLSNQLIFSLQFLSNTMMHNDVMRKIK